MQFLTVLLLSVIYCAGASVPPCREGLYVVVHRHIMPGWSHQLNSTNRIQCLLVCTRDTLCLSVSYNHRDGVCRINNKKRGGGELLSDSAFDYMEKVIDEDLKPHCQDALGVEDDGRIPDDQLTASSEYDSNLSADRGRLNTVLYNELRGGWCVRTINVNQWIQADLGDVKMVTGIITQGREDYNQWVTSYAIHYSLTGIDFEVIKGSSGEDKVFTANWDRNTYVTNIFNNAVNARIIRINPRTWHKRVCLRFEVLGCIDDE